MMLTKQLFITGTDTDCGKTYISKNIITSLAKQNYQVKGLKPIASGAQIINGELKNDDALALISATNINLPYHIVNPICFPEPIAPHIAAAIHQQSLSVQTIVDSIHETNQNYLTDYTIIEGAGGWFVPLNEQAYFSDLAIALQAEVVLVVGMKLGCINHAILTANAIMNSGVKFKGWVANCIDRQMLNFEENLQTLKTHIQVPCLAVVEHDGEIDWQGF